MAVGCLGWLCWEVMNQLQQAAKSSLPQLE